MRHFTVTGTGLAACIAIGLFFAVILQTSGNRINQKPAAFEIDFEHCGFGKRNEHGALAGPLEFEEITGAEVIDSRYGTVVIVLGVIDLEAFEIGIVELVLVKIIIRQGVAIDEEFGSVQHLGSVAVIDAAKTDDDHRLVFADIEHFEDATILADQIAIFADGQRIISPKPTECRPNARLAAARS